MFIQGVGVQHIYMKSIHGIVVKAGIKSDTLFLRAFFDLAEAEIDEPLDSLVVCTTHNGENIRFSFMTDTPVEVRILETVRDQESNYRYE